MERAHPEADGSADDGPATGTYAYDGHMRRVKSVVGGVTRYSVYDAGGGLVSIDQTGVGGGNTEYIRASGMTLARVVGASVTWLHHDHLGSAVAGTNSAGAVVWRESEQPFGEDWVSAAANDNQAGYTGHVEDAATGLVYMQARYYDPIIGRFLSIDPVGFTPGRPDMFNRYAYAANDPVNATDPTGMQCVSEFCSGGASSSGNPDRRTGPIATAARGASRNLSTASAAKSVDVSARQLEAVAVLTVAPIAPLIAVETGGMTAVTALGAGASYVLEGVDQAATASPDAGALLSETVQGGVLATIGGGITTSSMKYADDVKGGIALATTVNAIVLPQVDGVMNAADAARTGTDPAQAYGEGVVQTTLEVYTGVAGNIASTELEKRRNQ